MRKLAHSEMSIKGGSAGDIATGVACGVGYLVIFGGSAFVTAGAAIPIVAAAGAAGIMGCMAGVSKYIHL